MWWEQQQQQEESRRELLHLHSRYVLIKLTSTVLFISSFALCEIALKLRLMEMN
jgi:hypothetical protein